jgi:negative regulator of sigma E activity
MRQRQEYLGPDGRVADLLVSDGRIRWHYSPKTGHAKVLPLEPSTSLAKRLQLLARNYRFQLLGGGMRANRPVTLARFVPVHAGNLVHMLWVDNATHLPLAVERRDEDGKLVDRSEYLSIAFRPHFPPGAFTFQIPEGAQVGSTLTVLAHGRAGSPVPAAVPFRPALPQVAPAGYELMSWQYFKSQRQVPTFTWRFHDGLNSLSLFAVEERYQAHVPPDAKAVAVDGAQAFLARHGADQLLTWTAKGTNYTLVGHLPEAEMLRVARSTL